MEIKLTLTSDELSAIVHLLNDLPTKTNVYPLVQKIIAQANEQLEKPAE